MRRSASAGVAPRNAQAAQPWEDREPFGNPFQARANAAAVTNAVPLRTSQPGSAAFQIEGRVVDDPNKRPTADTRIVSANFLPVLWRSFQNYRARA